MSAQHRRGHQRPVPVDAAAVADVARAIHRGRAWGDVAAALGVSTHRARTTYQPLIGAELRRLRQSARRRSAAQRLAARAPLTDEALDALAQDLADGWSWCDIAAAGFPGMTSRQLQRRYREAVQQRVLNLLGDPDARRHGTRGGAVSRRGCRCEPCRYAHTLLQRAYKAEVAGKVQVRTDAAAVRAIAQRRHDGETWSDIALSMGRTKAFVIDTYRAAVQPDCLELVNAQPNPTHRPHGTHRKYVIDRCRCEPCAYANIVYERDRARKHARGLRPYVDAGPAREHVEWLRSEGVGLKRIALAGGLPHGALSKLVYGDPARGLAPSKRVRAATARRIMAVQPTAIAAGAHVDATESRALIAVLVDNGWTYRAICERVGCSYQGNPARRPRISARYADAIRRLAHDSPHPPPEARRQSRWSDRQAA